MGIQERRISSKKVLPSELAINAARLALSRAPHISATEIDVVIFCGIEKDQSEPATAHSVQDALGLTARHVFDVTNACFGFFDGLEIADLYVSAARARYALIVTGETQKKLVDSLSRQVANKADEAYVRGILGFFSLGDAGGAMIVGPTDNFSNEGFKFFKNKVNSKLCDMCYYRVGENGEYEARMLMSEIMNEGFDLQAEMIRGNLDEAGWAKFDWLLTHQTGKKNHNQTINLNVTNPGGVIKTFDKLGNVTSATLPVTFDALTRNPKVKRGDKVGGAFAGSGLVVGQFGYTM